MLGLYVFNSLRFPCIEPRNHQKVIEYLADLSDFEYRYCQCVETTSEQEKEVNVQYCVHWSVDWLTFEPGSHSVPKRKQVVVVESSGSRPLYLDNKNGP